MPADEKRIAVRGELLHYADGTMDPLTALIAEMLLNNDMDELAKTHSPRSVSVGVDN